MHHKHTLWKYVNDSVRNHTSERGDHADVKLTTLKRGLKFVPVTCSIVFLVEIALEEDRNVLCLCIRVELIEWLAFVPGFRWTEKTYAFCEIRLLSDHGLKRVM